MKFVEENIQILRFKRLSRGWKKRDINSSSKIGYITRAFLRIE